MEILGKILSSTARVKIMRLFLLNPAKGFSVKDVEMRSRVSSAIVRKEIRVLASADFISPRASIFLQGFNIHSILEYTAQ